MEVEEVRDVRGTRLWRASGGQKEYFEGYVESDREPVKEDRGDMVMGLGLSEEAGSRVLNHLESMEGADSGADEGTGSQ